MQSDGGEKHGVSVMQRLEQLRDSQPLDSILVEWTAMRQCKNLIDLVRRKTLRNLPGIFLVPRGARFVDAEIGLSPG